MVDTVWRSRGAKRGNGPTESGGPPNPLNVHVGAAARRLRLMRALSQESVASKLRLAPTEYANVENGMRGLQGTELYTLARILDVSVGDFYKDIHIESMMKSPG